MTMTLEDRLREIEEDLRHTDRLDVEKLLEAAGFTRHDDEDTIVYHHPGCALTFTFTTDTRIVPVPYVARIVQQVREETLGGG